MTTKDDDIKLAEKRGYASGYTAGRRRKEKEIAADRLTRQRNAFWQRAFLAALPAAISVIGCRTRSGEEITNVASRIELAAGIADRALTIARRKRKT